MFLFADGIFLMGIFPDGLLKGLDHVDLKKLRLNHELILNHLSCVWSRAKA